MTLVLPQGKVTAIKHLCTQIISLKEVTVCDIARLIGKLTAFIQAFFSSPSPLSPITELEIQSPSIEGDLRYPSQSQSSMSGRTTMVAGSPRCLEWPVHIDSPTRPSDRNRCIETGLVGGGGGGDSMHGYENRGPLVPERTSSAYQLPGAVSRGLCCEMFCEQPDLFAYSVQNGQYHRHCLHKQTRWDSLFSTVQPCCRPLDLSSLFGPCPIAFV